MLTNATVSSMLCQVYRWCPVFPVVPSASMRFVFIQHLLNMAFYLDGTKRIIRKLFFIHGLFGNPFSKSFSFVGFFVVFLLVLFLRGTA